MLLRGALLGVLLFSALCAETVLAGSSFLSPEYKKIQQRKDSRRPATTTTTLHRRSMEGFSDTTEAWAEDGSNSVEIKFNVPFEIGVKLTEEQYQEYGQTLEKLLGDVLEENAKVFKSSGE
ncbi:appetite-regulating hormone [Nothoprocta perdicaria]|uniref:appetite-regulating hormone n=1 Tax=Nothoprocta perdicaria TaxID=30464 RepID=UPI000E1BC8AD|nr:appetite-regulating hormone [Nothoprocta perdicaria]